MTELLSEEARRGIVEHFCSRAHGEFTTAIAFSHIIEDLNEQTGCSEFVRLAQSAREDELRHARLCVQIAQRFTDAPLPAPKARGTKVFEMPGASKPDQRILRTVFGCCFGETIAVQWLSDAHALCRDERALRENRDHLADEIKHSRLGWSYLGSQLLSRRDKGLIRSYVPLMCDLSRRLWCQAETKTDPGLEFFGCPSEAATALSVEKAIDEVILPGLDLCLGSST